MPACHTDQTTTRLLPFRSPMAPKPLSSFPRPTSRIYRTDPLPMAPRIQRDGHPTQPTAPVTVTVIVNRNHNEELLPHLQAQFHQPQYLPLPSHHMFPVTPRPDLGTLPTATITHPQAPMAPTRRAACLAAFPRAGLSKYLWMNPSTHAHLPSLGVHLPLLLPSTAA